MVLAVVALLVGAVIMLLASLAGRRAEQAAIDEIVRLKPLSVSRDRGGDEGGVGLLTHRVVNLASQVVDRMDHGRSLGQALERAKVPLRPGEFVVVLAGASLGAGALLLAVADSAAMAVLSGAATALLGMQIVRRRVTKRRRAFEAQLPDALGLIASSLSAGHTFLRAIQMMCEEAGPPMSEEFARVVAETRLGDSVVDALERMAGRLEIRDMDMVVQAIRIQQTVGGRLADLLHTLSNFIRARDEVRREVKVLTAEGRMSAYVLTGLVPFLFGVIKVMNPGYIAPLFHGWGLAILIYCGASVALGMVVILRMVKIDI